MNNLLKFYWNLISLITGNLRRWFYRALHLITNRRAVKLPNNEWLWIVLNRTVAVSIKRWRSRMMWRFMRWSRVQLQKRLRSLSHSQKCTAWFKLGRRFLDCKNWRSNLVKISPRFLRCPESQNHGKNDCFLIIKYGLVYKTYCLCKRSKNLVCFAVYDFNTWHMYSTAHMMQNKSCFEKLSLSHLA